MKRMKRKPKFKVGQVVGNLSLDGEPYSQILDIDIDNGGLRFQYETDDGFFDEDELRAQTRKEAGR